jgi:hypothetical protein
MDKLQAIETVNKLFIGVDERNWELVSNVFADKVLLDYTSMAGGERCLLRSKSSTRGKVFYPDSTKRTINWETTW